MVKVKDALFVILIHYPDLEPNRNQKNFRYGKGYKNHDFIKHIVAIEFTTYYLDTCN